MSLSKTSVEEGADFQWKELKEFVVQGNQSLRSAIIRGVSPLKMDVLGDYEFVMG